ncbi:hypothetical protein N9885_03285 [Flavobacteriaceae bacterium]|nr:hypothetical protein [Flavobacteriaceae bacterium]MDB4281074.1 hypothetical protein [Flavobacteriaceae bacterium]
MKKGLLSILASALLVVGCQNYDDQFTNLESQISALASTVAGLSQVQSDLSSLAGTVGSLTATVSNLGSTIDTAVADGLVDIQADITAIEAAVADVASSEEVSDLSDQVASSQEDLDELLTSSNFFSGDLTINSVSTLAFAQTLGEKLAIINGDVTIALSPTMDATIAQEVVDNIGTVVGDFDFSATTSAVTALTFDNISGTGDLSVDQAGPYSFAGLTSAGAITLGTSSAAKVTVVNLEALTTVTSIQTGTATHTISFAKATNIHLTALTRYGASLTLLGDDDSTILIDNLTSTDVNGLESSLALSITGAASVDFSNITQGSITAVEVATVTGGADFDGNISLTEVIKAVIPNYTGTLTVNDTDELEYLHVIGALPTRTVAATTYPVLDTTGQTALSTLIVDGTLGDVTISGNSDLETLTFTANVDALTITGASNLASAELAGKAKSIDVNTNGDLETLTITTALQTAKINAAAATSASLSVTGNTDLETLASSYNTLGSLTVTGNAKLAAVDFTGTDAIGTTANVAINTNAFEATVVNSYSASDTTTSDLTGSVSDESGISTLKPFLLKAIAAPGTSGVVVKIDEVELTTFTSATDTDGTESDVLDWEIVNVTAAGVATGVVTAAKSKIAQEFVVTGGTAKLKLVHTNPANGVVTTIIDMVAATAINTDASAMNTNPALAVINDILTDNAIATATAVGVTLNAYVGGSSSVDITLYADNDSSTGVGSAATVSNTVLAADDVVGLTVDGVTGTATISGALGNSVANLTTIAAEMAAAWNAVATATSTLYTVTSAGAVITVTGIQTAGSRADGGAVAAIVTTGSDTSTIPVLGHKIGFLRGSSDDLTASSNVIVTVESNTAGLDGDSVGAGVTASTGSVGATALSVTSTYTAASTSDVIVADAFADARIALDADAGTAGAAASTTNYLPWVTD